MGLYATMSVVGLIGALLYSWQLAALVEPGVVLLCTLTYYVRRGQPWARVITWVFFGLSAVTNAVSLSGLIFTTSVTRLLTTLLAFVLSCAVCMWLAAPDSNEFFAEKGLITRSYGPTPTTRDPVVARQPLSAPPQSAAPGWYPATDLPNDQLYWDGMGWTTRRRWTAAGYVEVDNANITPAAATQQTTEAVAPNAWSRYRTAVVLVVLATIPPAIAILTLMTT